MDLAVARAKNGAELTAKSAERGKIQALSPKTCLKNHSGSRYAGFNCRPDSGLTADSGPGGLGAASPGPASRMSAWLCRLLHRAVDFQSNTGDA